MAHSVETDGSKSATPLLADLVETSSPENEWFETENGMAHFVETDGSKSATRLIERLRGIYQSINRDLSKSATLLQLICEIAHYLTRDGSLC